MQNSLKIPLKGFVSFCAYRSFFDRRTRILALGLLTKKGGLPSYIASKAGRIGLFGEELGWKACLKNNIEDSFTNRSQLYIKSVNSPCTM